MVQWIMKACLYTTGSELLPAFGHLSFYLIHKETGFLIIWKFTSSFTLLLDENCKHKSKAIFFSFLTNHLKKSFLRRDLIILRICWVVASKSFSTGITLFDFIAQRYSVAGGYFSLSFRYLQICLKTIVP